MDWPDQCGVVVPCRDEARSIAALVLSVRQHLPTVVVIDDGSEDDTAARAEGAGAVVLKHPFSRGKGAALTSGLRWVHEKSFPWALLMDGDGQHSPSDIPAFLERQRSTGAAMVVGNRMGDSSRMPWIRRQVNRWMSARLSALMKVNLPDSQCGFRLVQVPLWESLHLATSHFEIESEMLTCFLNAGAQVEFVPIHVIYAGERTKISPIRDTIRWLRWWRQAKEKQLRPREAKK